MRFQYFLLFTLISILFSPYSLFSNSTYFKNWLVLGSFEAKTGTESLSYPYIKNEPEITAFGGMRTGALSWIQYHSDSDVLNLNSEDLKFEFVEGSVAYAQVFVFSEEEQPATLLVGSDDEIAIWCNRKKVHYNWIQRTHQFDEDEITLSLRQGWNRLLFKVVNGALNWQLSARLEAQHNTVVQAKYPEFIPLKFSTPPKIAIWKINPEITEKFSQDDQLLLTCNLLLRNEGTTSINDVSAILCKNKKEIASLPPIREIQGGEIFSYSFDLTYSEVDSIVQEDAKIQLHFSNEMVNNWQNFQLITIRNALQSLFESWELTDWETSFERGEAIFEKDWIVPEDFQKLALNFHVDIGQYTGNLYINNRRVLRDFTYSSGIQDLTNQARSGTIYTFKITIPADSDLFQRISSSFFKAEVIADFERIEAYLKEIPYADEIFKTKINFSSDDEKKLYSAIRQGDNRDANEILRDLEKEMKFISQKADSFTIYTVNHAQINPVHLWRNPQIANNYLSIFKSAIDLMHNNREYIFSHGQASSYWWIEQNDEDLFNEIKKYVKRGQWEIVGGTWVEPALSIIDGESLVRQFLYGKSYFKNRFNIDVSTGWMPNAYGQPDILPQILNKSGYKSYTFLRSDLDEYYFNWQAPDGSTILTHRPLSTFNSTHSQFIQDDLWKGMWQEKQKFGLRDAIRFYDKNHEGVEPRKTDIEKIDELNELMAFPRVRMTRMTDYYDNIINIQADTSKKTVHFASVEDKFPHVFNGCFTNQARIKWNNRRAECLLPITEMISCLAIPFDFNYPAEEFTDIWRDLLFTQSQDILSGTLEHAAYPEFEQIYKNIFIRSNSILNKGLDALASNVNTLFSDSDAIPIVVFNSGAWNRTSPIEFTIPLLPKMQGVQLFNTEGLMVPVQILEQVGRNIRFLFVASDIPEFGYRTFWIKQIPYPPTPKELPEDFILENEFLRIEINKKTGTINRLSDKKLNHNFINQSGALFQIQKDEPGNQNSSLRLALKGPIISIDNPVKIEISEDGEVRKVIRVEYQYLQSIFVQKYILYHELQYLEVQVTVDWQERNQMVKLDFPININLAQLTAESSFGHIQHEQNGKEFIAHKWVDLSNSEFGLTLINDCKYGFDVKDNTIRMSILRSPGSTVMNSDLGYHGFSYALFPHSGTWREGNAFRKGWTFNSPIPKAITEIHKGSLPPASSFLTIDPDNIMISALKKAEDNNNWILRMYETQGKNTEVKITLLKPVHAIYVANLMENKQEKIAQRGYEITIPISPYEIKTLRLEF